MVEVRGLLRVSLIDSGSLLAAKLSLIAGGLFLTTLCESVDCSAGSVVQDRDVISVDDSGMGTREYDVHQY